VVAGGTQAQTQHEPPLREFVLVPILLMLAKKRCYRLMAEVLGFLKSRMMVAMLVECRLFLVLCRVQYRQEGLLAQARRGRQAQKIVDLRHSKTI
jgi:hypothetical protein